MKPNPSPNANWRIAAAGILWLSMAAAGSATPAIPESPAAQDIDCESLTQAGMRDCLIQQAQRSAKDLKNAQVQARAAVAQRLRDDPHLLPAAQAKLEAANRAHAHYRQTLCDLEVAILGGAAGNARQISLLRCQVQLNNQHAAHLAALSR